MATNDIGRVTPIWRGFYSAAATYELNDIVIDTAGSVWWHKSEELTTGVIPEAGEIWDAVIDMSVFSGLIQAAITTAQTALEAAQAAVADVAADMERAETAADNAENSAAAASESAAGVGALAQAAERSAEAAAGSATGAAGSAQAAAGSKSDAEAYAVGKRGGEDVESTDPTYHNNAKYYAEQAASEAEAAAQSAEDAQDVLDSIPEDYSQLSADVGDLKTQISNLSEVDTTNLYNKDDTSNRFAGYPNSSKQLRNSDDACTVFISCLPNTKYTAQKMRSARFGFGYTNELPAHGVYAVDIISYADKDSITITTGAEAEYLILFCYLSTAEAEGVTLDQILSTVQIQTGDTATPYIPYHQESAVDLVARGTANLANEKASTAVQPETQTALLQLTTKRFIIDSANDVAKYETAITPALSDYTGTDATYSDGKWTIAQGGSISHDIDVVEGTSYRITLVVDSINITQGGVYVQPVTISLGSASISIFSANDANWDVCLEATETGTVSLTVAGSSGWGGVISGVRVLPVKTLISRTGKFDDQIMFAHGNNIAFGGGQANILAGTGGDGAPNDGSCGKYNTAFGDHAQTALNTGLWNSAFGQAVQRSLTNGKGNTGMGRNAQHSLTTGCYNNAYGESSQGQATTAQWNDAFGIETQSNMTTGTNNVAMGRRAQHLMTTGRMNTAVGAWSAFMADDTREGLLSTIDACFQTLIGCSATQSDGNKDDYLTAIGYKARGTLKAIALGALAKALGEESIAIGYDVTATNDNEIAIGKSTHTLILCGKIISFNQDGSVTWSAAT